MYILDSLPAPEIAEGHSGRGIVADGVSLDEAAIQDSKIGARQLGYNDADTPLRKALMRYGMAPAMRNWAYENLGAAYIVTLARIRCPVALVHCSADVAYPIKYTEAVQDLLYRAGIDARILTIEVQRTTATTNALLYEFLMGVCNEADLPPVPATVESPFLADLVAFGLLEDDDSSGPW
ncbi:hypothetical protein B0H13DRAFT_2101178 [Mycena leptocephala]|nr:hypothetical protein B0H13DRAFT_2101178 [Mycena leptocephala]